MGEAIERKKYYILGTCAYECICPLWNPLDCKINLRQFWPGVGSNPDVDHIYADILCAAGADVCGTGNSISYRWRSE